MRCAPSKTELTHAEINTALERERLAEQSEPCIKTVLYDQGHSRIIVDLTNGCTFVFPPRLAQGLEATSDDELDAVEILGAGYGLHWEALDVDLSILGLLAGLSGTKAHMAQQAGRTKSSAKAAAARARRPDPAWSTMTLPSAKSA